MAKLYPANLAPDAYIRVRGIVLARPWRGLMIAQTWPRKRGAPTNWRVIFTSKQFALASIMAANPDPIAAITAREMTKGTHWLPRDFLVRAAYGKAYEVYLPDGTMAHQADHGPPAPPTPPRPPVLQWQPNQIAGVNAATTSTSLYACKGTAFIPQATMTLYAIAQRLTPVSTATYQAFVLELNGSNVIQSVQSGTPVSGLPTTTRIHEFLIGATLDTGKRYAVLLGRTDGASNYALPVANGANANYIMPLTELGYARLASNNPAIGQTVDVGANMFAQSMLIEF